MLLTCPFVPTSIPKAVLPQFSLISSLVLRRPLLSYLHCSPIEAEFFFGKQSLHVLVPNGRDMVLVVWAVLLSQQPLIMAASKEELSKSAC